MNMSMPRIPEPKELMDETTQALAYAQADFSESNELFVKLFIEVCGADFIGHVLDVGCGPADIPLRLLRRLPGLRVHALDGAKAMLNLAQEAANRESDLMSRLSLQHKLLPATDLPARQYDAVVSNSLLHHLSNPLDLWRTLKHCAKDGAPTVMMDLKRPASLEEIDTLMVRYAADAPPVLREDFRNSLLAAYTPAEIHDQLEQVGLSRFEVKVVSDRHLAVIGRIDERL
jgi:2-polyprenyl-3-methyl-5-hydroxy-6-metoxy-1,4-benzoquinol methylase